MKRTLVLVVDRDDDFGVKGGIKTPVIGVSDCSVAATALGIADPEDSDINALYAAINIYSDIKKEGNEDVEVALIAGDKKIGYKSDSAIVDELEEVLKEVSPDRIILVGDGAEDEYVYPIISSRIPIDSVRKVYVKQTPGLEGTVYIISKILEDPAKRRRFLVPIGWIIALVSLVYLTSGMMSRGEEFISAADITTPFVGLLVGLFILLYAYNIPDWVTRWNTRWMVKIRQGSVTVTFVLIALLFLLAGVILGYFSLGEVYIASFFQGAVWFFYNGLWMFLFAVLAYQTGDLVDRFLSSRTIKLSFIIGSINIVAIGLIMTGGLDIILSYMDMGVRSAPVFILELIAGIGMALVSGILQRHMKEAIEIADTNKEAENNAVS